ncbi:hypothetical protein HRbin01_01854 [archaeon HR01]|nr:hypothetical protein HRbin01_01854 [archaeon HR01]
MVESLAQMVVELIESPDVVGLATHRHYPHERMIYSRFGRCGFSIDVVKMEGGVRRMYSVLVEAEAIRPQGPVKDFTRLPGRVTLIMARSGNGFTHTVSTAEYRSGDEFFSAVESVRQAFYRKYTSLRLKAPAAVESVGEEIFHQVGLTADELHLGV